MSIPNPARTKAPDTGLVSISRYGGAFDGAGDDSGALQSAFAALEANHYKGGTIEIDTRRLVLNGDFKFVRETQIDFRQAQVTATAAARLFDIGWGTTGVANCIGRPQVFGGLINFYGAGTTCFAIQNSGTVTIRDVDINLREGRQTGIHIKGSADPMAPYQGVIDSVRIRGNATPRAGQTGICLEGLPIQGSFTPNRWLISNISDCAALDVGIDIRGSDGLCLNNINLEACYVAGIRFGHGNRSYSGKVTLGLGAGRFVCLGFIGSTLDQSATIKFTSGANAGESCRVYYYEGMTGTVTLLTGMPNTISIGDAFTITEAKARNIKATNVTYEGSSQGETAVHFTEGALNCRVDLAMQTMPTGYVFRREIEDLSNTVASRYDIYSVEKKLSPGSGVEPFDPDFAASNQGGFILPMAGWIDAVIVNGSARGAGVAGDIEIEVFANGVSVAALKPRLTEKTPGSARKIRKSLTSSDYILPGHNIQVKANKKGLAVAERVRVAVYIGYET